MNTIRKALGKQTRATGSGNGDRFRPLFDAVPVPLLEFSISRLRKRFDEWRSKDIDELRVFLDKNPVIVKRCLASIEVLDANQAALQLYQANSREKFMAEARQIWTTEAEAAFTQAFILPICGHRTSHHFETVMRTLWGKEINVWGQWHIIPGHEQSLSRIFITTIDVSERKKSLDELETSREQLRAMSAHLQASREQERLAIARDLHDELGQALTSLKMGLSILERKAKSSDTKIDGTELLSDIGALQKLATGTLDTVRGLTTKLRPEVLDTLGLVSALEWQVQEFRKLTKIPCEFNAQEPEPPLAKEHAIALFRIFQESLTNIARHAKARKVTVKIEKHDGALWVQISDDGIGISQEKLKARGKFGLLGMRERALVFGGRVNISGVPGRGTTVEIMIPLAKDENYHGG